VKTLLRKQFNLLSQGRIDTMAATISNYLVDVICFWPSNTEAFVYIDERSIIEALSQCATLTSPNHPFFLKNLAELKESVIEKASLRNSDISKRRNTSPGISQSKSSQKKKPKVKSSNGISPKKKNNQPSSSPKPSRHVKRGEYEEGAAEEVEDEQDSPDVEEDEEYEGEGDEGDEDDVDEVSGHVGRKPRQPLTEEEHDKIVFFMSRIYVFLSGDPRKYITHKKEHMWSEMAVAVGSHRLKNTLRRHIDRPCRLCPLWLIQFTGARTPPGHHFLQQHLPMPHIPCFAPASPGRK
jgi:hypothetical protein